jgi:hypothetical protein
MRYLLVVGFACNVYRREPRARIFVGNTLIDEFHVLHHKDTFLTFYQEIYKDTHILQPIAQDQLNDIKNKNLPPLRFYEIEMDIALDRVTLRIEIENNDSNYSNGFMTDSTLLQLRACYFFPIDQRLLDKLSAIKNKNRPTENYAWYRRDYSRIFELSRNGIYWKSTDCKNDTHAAIRYNNFFSRGGNGEFICELKKKYGIFIPTFDCTHRHVFDEKDIDFLIDKYKAECASEI